jgi:hypothetical protein
METAMRRTRSIGLCLLAGATLAGGCAAASRTRTDRQAFRVQLDSEREVVLTETVRADVAADGRKTEVVQLRFEVHRGGQPAVGGVVAERTFARPEETQGFLRAGDELDVFTDVTRQKVWLVHVQSGRVFASVDCVTGEATGPLDPPPAWTAHGGAKRVGR